MKAEYMTVAVRTGGKGMNGISLLLLESSMPGIKRTRMKTQGWWTSTTAYIRLENVKVPTNHIIGELNNGFKCIVTNFNHERWVFAIMSNRCARVCLEEAIKFAKVRKTFGKRLVDHPVIRQKIAEMIRQIEAAHALIEQITYQMTQGLSAKMIAGTMAATKVQSTKTMEFCAREASQILGMSSFNINLHTYSLVYLHESGGASCIRGGHGEKIERIYREVRQCAIAGGSEEILNDFAVRQCKL